MWYISIWCSDSVVFLYMFFYMISELFWQCDIFWHDFWTVLTEWYLCTWFRNCSVSVVFPRWFRNCSDSVVFFLHVFLHYFGTALIVLYFSTCVCTRPGKWTVIYLCVRSIGVFFNSRILLHDFETVLTVWYFSTWFRNCSDSVVCFYMSFYMISELLWQCGICLHDFRTALTVWYFSTCLSTYFRNCSDGVEFY